MTSQISVLLIVNPISGDIDKENIVQQIKEKAHLENFPLNIHETTGKNDVKTISKLIEQLKPTRVWVMGGDGTVSLVAQCLLETDIILGILPSGSANGLAYNIGLPNEIEGQVKVALSPHILKIDVVFINGYPCLHIADIGINAELVKNYENSNIRGKLGYLLQSIPTIFQSDSPYNFTIETSEGVVEETGILLAIANAKKFGTGANINPTGEINDGLFEILVFKNLDFIEILKTVRDQPEMSSDFVSLISTDKAKVTTKTKACFQIDGEFMGEIQSADISIKKQVLNLTVPKDFLDRH